MNYTLDMSLFNTSSSNSCVLDQSIIVEQTTKLPKIGYYILLIGLACLLFYFFVQPKLSDKIRISLWESVGLMGTCFVFLSVWVLFFFVFQFTKEELNSLVRVTGWLILPLLLLMGIFVYRRYIKKWLNILR